MRTVVTDSPDEAAVFIKHGGIVAFPTETVFGLGADIFDPTAIGKIFAAKRRPADNPLIAHVGLLEQIGELVEEIPVSAQRLIDRFFPGPLTLVLKKTARVPLIATAGLDTIGVRMPGNKLANEFLLACGTPVVAPSANVSGRPSATTWHAVYEDLNGRTDCILKGESTLIGLESTVVDCSGEVPLVLRSGAVSIEQIQEFIPEIQAYKATLGDTVRSPGLKHRHYSPQARVVLMDVQADAGVTRSEDGYLNSAFIGITPPAHKYAVEHICSGVDEYAHFVFEFFRKCDRSGVEKIYCQIVKERGIGTALMDRLRRAAAG